LKQQPVIGAPAGGKGWKVSSNLERVSVPSEEIKRLRRPVAPLFSTDTLRQQMSNLFENCGRRISRIEDQEFGSIDRFGARLGFVLQTGVERAQFGPGSYPRTLFPFAGQGQVDSAPVDLA